VCIWSIMVMWRRSPRNDGDAVRYSLIPHEHPRPGVECQVLQMPRSFMSGGAEHLALPAGRPQQRCRPAGPVGPQRSDAQGFRPARDRPSIDNVRLRGWRDLVRRGKPCRSGTGRWGVPAHAPSGPYDGHGVAGPPRVLTCGMCPPIGRSGPPTCVGQITTAVGSMPPCPSPPCIASRFRRAGCPAIHGTRR